MPTSASYRIEDIGRLAETLAALDRSAMRRFGDLFAHAVARETARLIDAHSSGIDPKDPVSCPLQDAVEAIRSRIFIKGSSLTCQMRLILRETHVDVFLHAGTRAYLDAIAEVDSISFVSPSVDMAPAPAGQPVLSYRIPSGPVPAPKWTSVRLRVPSIEDRAKALVPQLAKRCSLTPTQALDHATRLIPATIDRDEMRRYGDIRQATSRPAISLPSPPAPNPQKPASVANRTAKRSDETVSLPASIDHADIIETMDGHVFIAIMDAGFSRRDRIIVNLGGRDITFLQGGKDHGTVPDMPSSAVRLLRQRSFVSVVEMARRPGKNEILNHHMAQVRDIGDMGDIGDMMTRWRSRIPTTNKKAETEWASRRDGK